MSKFDKGDLVYYPEPNHKFFGLVKKIENIADGKIIIDGVKFNENGTLGHNNARLILADEANYNSLSSIFPNYDIQYPNKEKYKEGALINEVSHLMFLLAGTHYKVKIEHQQENSILCEILRNGKFFANFNVYEEDGKTKCAFTNSGPLETREEVEEHIKEYYLDTLLEVMRTLPKHVLYTPYEDTFKIVNDYGFEIGYLRKNVDYKERPIHLKVLNFDGNFQEGEYDNIVLNLVEYGLTCSIAKVFETVENTLRLLYPYNVQSYNVSYHPNVELTFDLYKLGRKIAKCTIYPNTDKRLSNMMVYKIGNNEYGSLVEFLQTLDKLLDLSC